MSHAHAANTALSILAEVLHAATSVAVIGHVRPDADAIGSVTALVSAVRRLGIQAQGYIGQADALPQALLTIPGADQVLCTDTWAVQPDLIITVDCGDLQRTGSLAAALERQPEQLMVIDHHDTNPRFGRWNLVDAAAESTTVIVYDLLAAMGVALDTELAHQLYAGLLTDTGGFRWGSPRMHRVAARLVDHDIDIQQISDDLMTGITAPDLLRLGEVLGAVRQEVIGGVHVASVVLAAQVHEAMDFSTREMVTRFVQSLRGIDLAVVYKETSPGTWSVSLRSRSLDVSAAAIQLGGGGHERAAGLTLQAPLADVAARLHQAIVDLY